MSNITIKFKVFFYLAFSCVMQSYAMDIDPAIHGENTSSDNIQQAKNNISKIYQAREDFYRKVLNKLLGIEDAAEFDTFVSDITGAAPEEIHEYYKGGDFTECRRKIANILMDKLRGQHDFFLEIQNQFEKKETREFISQFVTESLKTDQATIFLVYLYLSFYIDLDSYEKRTNLTIKLFELLLAAPKKSIQDGAILPSASYDSKLDNLFNRQSLVQDFLNAVAHLLPENIRAMLDSLAKENAQTLETVVPEKIRDVRGQIKDILANKKASLTKDYYERVSITLQSSDQHFMNLTKQSKKQDLSEENKLVLLALITSQLADFNTLKSELEQAITTKPVQKKSQSQIEKKKRYKKAMKKKTKENSKQGSNSGIDGDSHLNESPGSSTDAASNLSSVLPISTSSPHALPTSSASSNFSSLPLASDVLAVNPTSSAVSQEIFTAMVPSNDAQELDDELDDEGAYLTYQDYNAQKKQTNDSAASGTTSAQVISPKAAKALEFITQFNSEKTNLYLRLLEGKDLHKTLTFSDLLKVIDGFSAKPIGNNNGSHFTFDIPGFGAVYLVCAHGGRSKDTRFLSGTYVKLFIERLEMLGLISDELRSYFIQ